MKAKDIMTEILLTVAPEATIREIAKVLVDNRISGVPVVEASGKLVGIVSEGDLLHKEVTPRLPDVINILGAIIYYHGVERYNEDFKKMMAKTAREIMTPHVLTVGADAEVGEIGKLLISHNIKRVPVVDDAGQLIGMISRTDIIKTLLM